MARFPCGRESSYAAGNGTALTRRSPGDTTVRMSRKRVPKLPHERDESPERGRKPEQPVIERAAGDLEQGRKDTDRAPETNRLARKLSP